MTTFFMLEPNYAASCKHKYRPRGMDPRVLANYIQLRADVLVLPASLALDHARRLTSFGAQVMCIECDEHGVTAHTVGGLTAAIKII